MDMTISIGNIVTMLGMVVAMSISWGVLKQRLDDHETRLKRHTGELENTDVCLIEIKVKLAEIARDILYIRERMDKEGR
jgi:hypothetical protein